MSGFSENDIKEILGEETADTKEKNSKVPAAIGIGAVLVAVILAIVIPLSTIKNDEAPDMGGNKHEISPITDFEYTIAEGYATIEKYIGDDKVVVIPEKAENAPVKHIGDNAFSDVQNVEKVVMPDGVLSVGELAFSDMEQLKTVLLPDSLETVGEGAFSGCSSLETISLPENVTTVSANCFSFCSALTSVTLSSGTTDIGERAFNGCSALTEILLPETVTSIGTGAFSGAGLTSFTLPSGVTVIPELAFSNCKDLGRINFNGSITEIGNKAFTHTSLQSVIIPDSVTKLGEQCFGNCYFLLEITIPDSVTSIGPYAFANCEKLISVKLSENITEIPDGFFMNCSRLTEIDIPESVKSIGSVAFYNCESINRIKLPEKLEKINARLTFCNCKRLNELVIPDSVTSFTYEYGYDALAEIEGLNFITGATSLKSIYLPSTFNDENIGAILSEAENPSLVVFEGGNENYTIKDGNLYNSDMSVLIYADTSNVKSGDICKYAVIPESVKEINKYALGGFDSDVYILMPDGFSDSEYDTKAKIITDKFLKGIIISDEKTEREINKSISDAYLEIKKTNASFCTTDKIVISKLFPNVMIEHSVYAYISTDVARRHTVHIYPASLEDMFETLESISDSYGQYLETPKTYVSDTLGEYRIRFSTTDYNDEFIGTSEIVDYFLICDTEFTDYFKAIDKAVEIYERSFNEKAEYPTYTITPMIANKESGYKTLVIDSFFYGSRYFHNVEIYPSGYYGDNGEEVFTTENGEFEYSVRLVSTKTGEIYY